MDGQYLDIVLAPTQEEDHAVDLQVEKDNICLVVDVDDYAGAAFWCCWSDIQQEMLPLLCIYALV